MKVVFVQAAWRRYDVTRLALAQQTHLCGELSGRGLEATAVVVADDENLDIAAEHGFATVEQDNRFLGRRFNDGIEHACRDMEADYVVFTGSDNWMHPDLFDRLPDGAADPPEITSGRELAVVNLETGMLQRCRAKGLSGTIPWIIPRQALERCRFRPIGDKQGKGTDYSLLRGLGVKTRLVFADPHDVCRVDFKTETNLNTYEGIGGSIGYGAEEPAWAALAERYPAELVELARETSGLAVAA